MSEDESIAEATSDTDTGWPPDRLAALRGDRRQRWAALAVLAGLGLALAWVHWAGLLVAGVLVGVVSRSTPRAVAAGLSIGVAAVALTVLLDPAMGVAELLALRPPVYVTLAGGLLPVWGSLVRALG